MNLGSLIPWRERPRPSAREQRMDSFSSADREIDAFRREVDRVFDEFFVGPLFGTRHFGDLSPSVDVREDGTHIVVSAEVPGLDEKDLDITIAGDVLTIRGEKVAEAKNENAGAHYVERRFGSFSRSIQLPTEVSEEDVEATYAKGVLTIRLPKPADARREPRRIEVKAR
ncbi:Hsp20/alpha crystallin family protein [Hyphomicrobium sp.]|uniref:Hsp20/alpha crystallin family protein n=1 Tax=Hyphomicrobium sp. TaxID=82 RepID=UPI002E3423B8|nr:Hsp20/alpha crystallin family protein [Hyphomicrobium sp.]HEX2841371.1 Hsp20/alpha crystallin family protein [Hyphomicrobium sp.]